MTLTIKELISRGHVFKDSGLDRASQVEDEYLKQYLTEIKKQLFKKVF